MKNIFKKARVLGLLAANAVMMLPVYASAAAAATTKSDGAGAAPNFESVASPIKSLIESILSPAIGIVGALGTVYCVFLGVKFARAEEPQEREKAKSHLKNAIIGFVLIFVLMLTLRLTITPLSNWATGVTG